MYVPFSWISFPFKSPQSRVEFSVLFSVVVQSLNHGQLFAPQGLQHARLPVLHCVLSLLKLMSTESVMSSKYLILHLPLLLLHSTFPSIRDFSPMSWSFTSGGQSIGASASVSDLPMNIQSSFPVGLMGLISLLPRGFSKESFPA